ncbi:MAG: hypothetical protein V4495_24775 [Pseudomonadota bacterium]
MSRYFSKIGVWLFMLTVAWYLAGNFLLNNVKKEQLSHAQSIHVTKQQADIGSNNRAVIRTQDTDARGVEIDLIFDPAATQAMISNENMQLGASAQFIDGVFNITIGKGVATRGGYPRGKTEIRLPATVSKVEFFGVSNVRISGSFPAQSTELTVEFLNSASRVTVNELLVSRLKLVSGCQSPAQENDCSLNLDFNGQIQVAKLEMTMQHGSLNYSGIGVPQETLLNAGSDVIVTGRRDFLQSLRFGSGKR